MPGKTLNEGNVPQFIQILGPNGEVWRYAVGTKTEFALNRIKIKQADLTMRDLYIQAVKEGEEPVEFGPDAELVNYGDDWKLQLVLESCEKPVEGSGNSTPREENMEDTRKLIAEFYPGGKVPAGSSPECSREYIGKVMIALCLIFLLAAALQFALEQLPPISNV